MITRCSIKGLLAIAAITLASCTAERDTRSVREKISPGMRADQVVSILGEPSSRSRDPKQWAFVIKPEDACDASRIHQSWLYNFGMKRKDALVFFDASKQVLCVVEAGMIFEMSNP